MPNQEHKKNQLSHINQNIHSISELNRLYSQTQIQKENSDVTTREKNPSGLLDNDNQSKYRKHQHKNDDSKKDFTNEKSRIGNLVLENRMNHKSIPHFPINNNNRIIDRQTAESLLKRIISRIFKLLSL